MDVAHDIFQAFPMMARNARLIRLGMVRHGIATCSATPDSCMNDGRHVAGWPVGDTVNASPNKLSNIQLITASQAGDITGQITLLSSVT